MKTTLLRCIGALPGAVRSRAHRSSGFTVLQHPGQICDMHRRWKIPPLCRLLVFFRQDLPPKKGSGSQENRLNPRFLQQAERPPARQGCRLPTILPVSQTTTDLPAIIGHPGPDSAHNRAKTGNGEFRRVSWQTARECGFVAISRGREITRNSPVCTLAARVPQRFWSEPTATWLPRALS